MARKFGTQIDTMGIPIKNLSAEQMVAFPTTPFEGQEIHRTDLKQRFVYLNSGWLRVDGAAFAAIGHTHSFSDIPGLQTALDGKAAAAHNHDASSVFNTGVVPINRGGTGTSVAPTPGGVIYGSSATALASTAAGTSGQLLASSGAGAPVWVANDMTAFPTAAFKKSVRAASTTNVALPPGGTTLIIDTIALVNGDRVLLKNQTTPAQNGIYTVSGVGSSVVLTRSTDADLVAEIANGFVGIDSGSQGGQFWSNTFKATDTLGTTSMSWYKVLDSLTDIAAGTGLTKTGTLGGGNLSFAVTYGTTAGTAAQGNDSRLSDSRAPTGTAGGVLSGTYPNPALAANVVAQANIAANLLQTGVTQGGVTGTAGATVAALRKLGTGADDALAGNTRLDQLAAPTAPVSANNQRITSVATPTSDTDAANKAYVDATAQGLAPKGSVRIASTTNLALNGLAAIDGITPAAGNRILAKDQTTPSANGIYVAAAGAWTRASDADTAAELRSAFVFVEEGTQADTGWLQTADAITLGTTALTFVQFAAAGQLTFSAPMVKSGNNVTLSVDGTSITVTGSELAIADLGVTAAKLAVGAVDLTSNKVTGVLPVAKGGTGGNTARAGLVNLLGAASQSGVLTAMAVGTWTVLPGVWNTGVNPYLGDNVLIKFTEIATGEDIEFETRRNPSTTFYEVRSDIVVPTTTYAYQAVGLGV